MFSKKDYEVFPEFERNLLEKYVSLAKYRTGEILLSEYEPCERLFLVVKGALRIYYFDPKGVEITRSFVLEDCFCTNLLAFSGQAENNENIQCLEDTVAYSIAQQDFYAMLAQSHFLTQRYAQILELYIARHLRHFQFMNMLSPKERVLKFLKSEVALQQRIKGKIIASFLGVSPEFYSKIKSEFLKQR